MPVVEPKNFNNENDGGWNGSGTPPNIGTDNVPGDNSSTGLNNSSPQSTALNVPATDDYSGWNWEQILNGVLGLSLPSRNEVTNLRWTVTNGDAGSNGSLFKIFGVSWLEMSHGAGSIGVYLNPGLQDSGGPWDEYYNTPVNQLAEVLSGPGGNYSGVQVDPKDFVTAGLALDGVEFLYNAASTLFDQLAGGLNSEASQYKGAGGEAFYQIVRNLNTNAQSIYSQMWKTGYGQSMDWSGGQTANFVIGLWNALMGWVNTRLDFSPVGAIFQALLDGGIIQNDGNGNYSVPQNFNAIADNPSFGNLLTDGGWLQVESAAKQLWLSAINSSLDQVAQPLVTGLADTYLNTASILQPLNPPSMSQIAPPNVNDGGFNGLANSFGDGFNGLANMFGGGFDGLANMFGSGFNGIGNGFNGLGDMFASGFNGLGGGLGNIGAGLGAGFNGLGGGLGNIGAGLGAGFNGLGGGLGNIGAGLGAGFNSPGGPGGNLNTPAVLTSNLNTPGGLGGSLTTPGGLTGNLTTPGGLTGALGTNPNVLSGALGNPGATGSLQSALGDSQAEQQALQHALALAPSSGPLHNALETALAANGQEQNALESALAGNTPAGTALQTALADNSQAQSALNRAMASGQVPTTGPLRTSLQQALGDNTKTRHALQHALSASVPGGTSLEHALTDNGKVQSALRHALASGQVPRTGPLHNALETALADSGKAKTALDQALAGNGAPASIQHALTENKAVQAQLQKALASSQVPKTGPLHNELESALANTRGIGNALHQALTSAGIPAEAGKLITSPALPGATLGSLGQLLGGGKGLTAHLGSAQALSAGAGGGTGASGPAGLGGAAGTTGAGASAGLASATGVPASSGRFVAPAAQPAGQGSGAVPFFPPMAGGGMGMGGGAQQGLQERERTTWLAEDEDVWGTEPSVGPAVLGRDVTDLDDDLDDYEDYTEPTAASRRSSSRAQAR